MRSASLLSSRYTNTSNQRQAISKSIAPLNVLIALLSFVPRESSVHIDSNSAFEAALLKLSTRSSPTSKMLFDLRIVWISAGDFPISWSERRLICLSVLGSNLKWKRILFGIFPPRLSHDFSKSMVSLSKFANPFESSSIFLSKTLSCLELRRDSKADLCFFIVSKAQLSWSLICSGESFFTRFLVSYPLITLSRPRVAQTPATPAATPIAIDFAGDSFSDSWVCFSFLSCDKNWGSDFWCGSQATSPACKTACIFSWLLDELEAKICGVSLACVLTPVKISFFNAWSSSSVFLVSISVLFSFIKAKIWFAMSGVTKLMIFFHHQNSLTSSNFWGKLASQLRIFFISSLIGKRTSDFRNQSCSLKSSKYFSDISDFNCSIATIYQMDIVK